MYPQHVCIEYPQHIFYGEMEKMNIHNIYMYGVSTTYVLWRNGENVYPQHVCMEYPQHMFYEEMEKICIHNICMFGVSTTCFMKKWRKCVSTTYAWRIHNIYCMEKWRKLSQNYHQILLLNKSTVRRLHRVVIHSSCIIRVIKSSRSRVTVVILCLLYTLKCHSQKQRTIFKTLILFIR